MEPATVVMRRALLGVRQVGRSDSIHVEWAPTARLEPRRGISSKRPRSTRAIAKTGDNE
jgi:hypothetical protein